MQCRALARRCPTGSATILGDLAQATADGAVADWERTLVLLGQQDGHTVALTRGYRVPAEVLDFANRLLPSLGVDVAAATSLRHAPGSLRVRQAAHPAVEVARAVRELLDLPGSIGVIGTDEQLAATTARRSDQVRGDSSRIRPRRCSSAGGGYGQDAALVSRRAEPPYPGGHGWLPPAPVNSAAGGENRHQSRAPRRPVRLRRLSSRVRSDPP